VNASPRPRDERRPSQPGIHWLSIAALVFAVASLVLPAVGSIILSGAAIVLAVLARRQLRRDPEVGPAWVSLAALILAGFVFFVQAVIFALVYLAA
jgi:hypothetical protein